MKKSLLISLALMLCCGIAFAQTTVTGTVVDTKGNPMPGAKVQVKGTNEYVITNMDGTFNIELKNPKSKFISKYVGWNTSIDRAKDGMVIKMKKTTWWTEKPEKWQWFAGVNAAFPTSTDIFSNVSPGIMFGMMKDWGWYAKGHYNGDSNSHDCSTPLTGESKVEYWSASAGVIKRLGCPIYLYAGAGAVNHQVMYEHLCGGYEMDDYKQSDKRQVIVDLGLMIRYKKVFVQGGIQKVVSSDTDNAAANFGIGYIF